VSGGALRCACMSQPTMRCVDFRMLNAATNPPSSGLAPQTRSIVQTRVS
jgi:hypothetical protein